MALIPRFEKIGQLFSIILKFVYLNEGSDVRQTDSTHYWALKMIKLFLNLLLFLNIVAWRRRETWR